MKKKSTVSAFEWFSLGAIFTLLVVLAIYYFENKKKGVVQVSPVYRLQIIVNNFNVPVPPQYSQPPYKDKVAPEKKKSILSHLNEILLLKPAIGGIGIDINKALEKAIA